MKRLYSVRTGFASYSGVIKTVRGAALWRYTYGRDIGQEALRDCVTTLVTAEEFGSTWRSKSSCEMAHEYHLDSQRVS